MKNKIRKNLKISKNDTSIPDYYFNSDGLMVFTENYHLKRGYCCKNNCKHCPFKKLEF